MQQETKTYQEIQSVRHPGSPLAGVSLGLIRKANEQVVCIGRKVAGDPGQKPSGMTTYLNNPLSRGLQASSPARGEGTIRGFTLIELLVVVLIIGILAAVALPQYQLAVMKSRASSMLPLLKTIILAEERHYLANGTYISDLRQLDVSLPKTCEIHSNNSGGMWKCGKYFYLAANLSDGVVSFHYCPGKNWDYTNCEPVRDFALSAYVLHPGYANYKPYAGTLRCIGDSVQGRKVCQHLLPQ